MKKDFDGPTVSDRSTEALNKDAVTMIFTQGYIYALPVYFLCLVSHGFVTMKFTFMNDVMTYSIVCSITTL